MDIYIRILSIDNVADAVVKLLGVRYAKSIKSETVITDWTTFGMDNIRLATAEELQEYFKENK